MIDAHGHLHFEAFDGEREAALTRAIDAGVSAVVVADYDHRRREMLRELRGREGVAVCAGLHPWALDALSDEALERELELLEEALGEPGWAAVGEFGLDFVRAEDKTSRERQIRAFNAQLRLAKERDLPVVLHAVRCHSTLHDLLRTQGSVPAGGIMHGYSGSSRQVPLFLMHGLDISVGGRLVQNVEKLKAVVSQVPSDRLHLETDCPDGPVPGEGKARASEPADVVEVARAVAQALHQPLEKVARQCARNSRRLFGLGEGKLSRA